MRKTSPRYWISMFAALLLWASLAPLAMQAQSNPDTFTTSTPGSKTGSAVLALYTSEGCSSCPPADALLANIQQRATKNKLPIYPLAFHVDYWDHLGWKDPYSSPEFTKRQRTYASVWNARQVYTPQMIVNGNTGFVGSNSRTAQQQINAALTVKPDVQIALTATTNRRTPLQTTVAYNITPLKDDLPETLVLSVALTQNGIATKVQAGENGGRELLHQAVVRMFKTIPLTKENLVGSIPFSLPDQENNAQKPDPKQTRILAFVQDIKTMRILGASQIPFPTAAE